MTPILSSCTPPTQFSCCDICIHATQNTSKFLLLSRDAHISLGMARSNDIEKLPEPESWTNKISRYHHLISDTQEIYTISSFRPMIILSFSKSRAAQPLPRISEAGRPVDEYLRETIPSHYCRATCATLALPTVRKQAKYFVVGKTAKLGSTLTCKSSDKTLNATILSSQCKCSLDIALSTLKKLLPC